MLPPSPTNCPPYHFYPVYHSFILLYIIHAFLSPSLLHSYHQAPPKRYCTQAWTTQALQRGCVWRVLLARSEEWRCALQPGTFIFSKRCKQPTCRTIYLNIFLDRLLHKKKEKKRYIPNLCLHSVQPTWRKKYTPQDEKSSKLLNEHIYHTLKPSEYLICTFHLDNLFRYNSVTKKVE